MIGAHQTTGSSANSGSADTPVCASGAAKKPAANSSESPGRNGKNTTPVSMKTIRKMKPRVGATPMAIQLAIAVRGSLMRLTKKLMIFIGLSVWFCAVARGRFVWLAFPSCATNVPLRTNHRLPTGLCSVRRSATTGGKSAQIVNMCLWARACWWCSAGGARWLFNGCPAAVQRAQRLSGASGASGVRVGHAGESWPELVVLRRSSDGARVASHLILAIRWRKTSHDFDFWRLFSSRATPNTP